MLVTALIVEVDGEKRRTDLYLVPECNIGDETREVLRTASGHYVTRATSNPPPISSALNTVLELVAGEWSRYKISGDYFEDHDYGIVRIVVIGYEEDTT
jgi:hypothetical protein